MEQIQQSKIELSRKHRDEISARRAIMAREKEREYREREARIEDKLKKFREKQTQRAREKLELMER